MYFCPWKCIFFPSIYIYYIRIRRASSMWMRYDLQVGTSMWLPPSFSSSLFIFFSCSLCSPFRFSYCCLLVYVYFVPNAKEKGNNNKFTVIVRPNTKEWKANVSCYCSIVVRYFYLFASFFLFFTIVVDMCGFL